jgi:hypothetical protein
MVEGLQKIGVSVTYNPRSLENVGSIVIVPGGFSALRQAIAWKRTRYISKLLAGPNLLDFPSEKRTLMLDEEIDTCLVPGDWFKRNFIDDCPELKDKVRCWPAGVDIEYWQPKSTCRSPHQILLYDKANKSSGWPIDQYLAILHKFTPDVVHLVYGSYTNMEYLQSLRSSFCLVGLDTDESQGIAWAEAWAVDVPTLLRFQDLTTYKGRTYQVSTAPYLTDRTGAFFRNMDELRDLLSGMRTKNRRYEPRDWVLQNMSDEVCAQRLMHIAGGGKEL